MSDKHEYWLICFYGGGIPFQLKVEKANFDVAVQDDKATIYVEKKGKEYGWVIQSKKMFTHLNKTFLVTQVAKRK
jgi:hypothetical protein